MKKGQFCFDQENLVVFGFFEGKIKDQENFLGINLESVDYRIKSAYPDNDFFKKKRIGRNSILAGDHVLKSGKKNYFNSLKKFLLDHHSENEFRDKNFSTKNFEQDIQKMWEYLPEYHWEKPNN